MGFDSNFYDYVLGRSGSVLGNLLGSLSGSPLGSGVNFDQLGQQLGAQRQQGAYERLARNGGQAPAGQPGQPGQTGQPGGSQMDPAQAQAQTQAGANAMAHLAQYAPLVQANAEATGVDPRIWYAVIEAESGGNPTAGNRGSGARGLLQHMPDIWAPQNPALLDDPAYSMQIARPRFQAAYNDTVDAANYGWNMQDPIERAVWTIAKGQVYGANPDGFGPPAYMQPLAPSNQRVRQIVRGLYQQTGYPDPNVLTPQQVAGA